MPNQNKCYKGCPITTPHTHKKDGTAVSPNQNKQEEWKEEIRMVKRASNTTMSGYEVVYDPEALINQIESLLHQEREKAVRETENEYETAIEWCSPNEAPDIKLFINQNRVLHPTTKTKE